MEKSILERLKKIKKLAECGVDGEKAAALKLLKQHLDKLGLKFSDLEDEKRSLVFFKYSTKHERTLVLQLVGSVIGWKRWKDTDFYNRHQGKKKLKEIGVELAEWEKKEIHYLYAIYKQHLKKFINESVDIAVRAFCQRNKLLADPDEADLKVTPEEIEKALKAEAMCMGMKRVPIPRKALTC